MKINACACNVGVMLVICLRYCCLVIVAKLGAFTAYLSSETLVEEPNGSDLPNNACSSDRTLLCMSILLEDQLQLVLFLFYEFVCISVIIMFGFPEFFLTFVFLYFELCEILTSGMAIFDTMKHVRPDVTTVCVGLAAR